MTTKSRSFHDLFDTELTEDHHASAVGLIGEEYDRLKLLLGRRPNKVELGIVGALWSEHCSYKSTKAYLSRLPTKGKNVLVGPGENAGVVDIGDGLAVVFKIESHNHPSYIEPFHGAATGVGGILRDVFTMGARPIAAANLLRFGDPSHAKTKALFHGVVAGIAHYGNCFGVPTVLSDIDFHSSYNGNILVNAFAIGVLNKGDIFLGEASGVKNRLIYVGAKTGRDGIFGAVMASDSFSDNVEVMRPTVQVGDPFTEKLLLEACLLAFKEKLVEGIQDMGAAGLTSSSFEMASKASTGLTINLDRVPLRDPSMAACDIMLSESQERMLLVAKPSSVPRLSEIFSRFDLHCTDIGHVTGDGLVRIFYKGQEVVDLFATLITENAPRYRRSYLSDIPYYPQKDLEGPKVSQVLDSFKKDLGQRDLSFVTNQFDHHIGQSTIVGPNEADAALIRVPHSQKAVAIALWANGKLSKINPLEGARRHVFWAYLAVSCQGAHPIGITNCLNFGSPENIEVMTDLRWVIDGMAQAANSLDVPIVSGNVSLYNETKGSAILPTLALCMVGLTESITRHTKTAYAQEHDILITLGELPSNFVGSEAHFSDVQQKSPLRPWDADAVMRLGEVLKCATLEGLIKCSSVVGRGGLLKSIVQIMAHSHVGAVLNFGAEWLEKEISVGLVSENALQVLISISKDNLQDLSRLCANKLPINRWGFVGGEHFVIKHKQRDIFTLNRHDLENIFNNDIGEFFAP